MGSIPVEDRDSDFSLPHARIMLGIHLSHTVLCFHALSEGQLSVI